MVKSRAEAPFPSFTNQWHTTSYPAISPQRKELSAQGKAVVITGGASGIGARTVLSFAEAGASHIAIIGRTEKKLIDIKASVNKDFPSGSVSIHVADVSKAAEIKQALAAVAAQVGELHVLVNNAGIGNMGPLIKDAEAEPWMEHIDVNLKGSLFTVQAFLHHARPDAVILNITSLNGFMPWPRISAYAVSKAASTALFSCLQLEYPEMRVVNVQPGAVMTDMYAKSGAPAMDDASLPADFLVWLTSEEASFAKGKFMFANWDVEEMVERAEEIRKPGVLQMWIEGLEHK